MASVIAITGKKKVAVFTGLPHQVAAAIRRELAASEENFDMLGNTVCKYRLCTK